MELILEQETENLEQLEEKIKRNIGAFYEVGRALMEIRDRELYKFKNGGEFRTFEAYCKSVWDLGRRTAYQFIDSVKVIENVRNCAQIPATESQARPLARLEPEMQREVWQKAVETAPDGKVTASHVQETVNEVIGEHIETIVIQEKESEGLYMLKRWWVKSSKKERKLFIEWINNQ